MNHITKIFILSSILMVFVQNSPAQTEISGFFDVINGYNFSEKKNSGFQINQFEVDLSYTCSPDISVAAAMAHVPDENKIELAMVYIHYNFFKSGARMHPHREETSPHFGLVIGKFDVPFGLDYLSFASPDRPIVSQPLIIEKSIGGWNDLGMNIHLVRPGYSVEFSVVNGFADGVNLVGQVRKRIFKVVKIGLAHARDMHSFSETNNYVSGLNLCSEIGDWQLKSEYLWVKGLHDGEQDTSVTKIKSEGFYAQLLGHLEKQIGLPLFVTLRYGAGSSSAHINQFDLNRISLGLGYDLSSTCSLRVEFISGKEKNQKRDNMLTFQFVVSY